MTTNYRNRYSRNNNNGGNNNGNYVVTTKSDVQFYNSKMKEEYDNSTLSFSFWKNNILFSINPMFTQEERKQLEQDDNRIYNYDTTMTIALDGKTAYKLYKGICTLEALIKKGSKVSCVAVATATKVIKIGDGSEYGHDNWYLGIFNKENADGLLYFFNKDLESDELIFNYNEETLSGQVKTINTELEIIKEVLREAPLMLSKGYVHEVRQELSRLKSHLDSKLTSTGGSSRPKSTSTSSVSTHRRTNRNTSVANQDTSFDPSEFSNANEDLLNEFAVENEVSEFKLNDLADLEDDFSIDED